MKQSGIVCHHSFYCSIFILALFFVFPANTYSGGWTLPQRGLFAKVYYLSSSAASYRENDGSEIISFKDIDKTTLLERRYATDFSGNGVGLYAEYGILDNLTAVFDMPFSTFGLTETYSIDNLHFDYETRRKFSVTHASWIGFGARWQVVKTDRFVASFSGALRLPPGFSTPDTGRTDYPFLSDGTTQIISGIEIGYSFKTGWIEVEARYNHRQDDFKDEVLAHIETGFSNIPKTYLKIFADAAISASSFHNIAPFNPMQSQLQETNYNAGASFTAFISDTWFLDTSYSIRIYGLNTWNIKTLAIGGGIKLPIIE